MEHNSEEYKKFLIEQAGINPATDDTFNPCTNPQFDFAPCVYAGRKLINGAFSLVGGVTGMNLPPIFQASQACGMAGYDPINPSPPAPCLYYDVAEGGYFIYDTGGITTSDCDSSPGCSWGDTVTFNDGSTRDLDFIGYECISNQCTEDNSGSATYNTLQNCVDSGCGPGQGNLIIGCNDVFSADYDTSHGGCDSQNTGSPNPLDVSCCGYTAGCLDERVFSDGTYVALNTAWASGLVGPVPLVGSSAIVADGANVVQLDDDTAAPWGFPAATLTIAGFAPPTCNYPVPNTISDANGCMDDTATNYGADYEADCGAVPILFNKNTGANNDPRFPGETMDTSCCTYNEGCMDDEACNYDVNATVDDGSCEYSSCVGCMNPIAVDYVGATTSVPGPNYVLDCAGNPVLNNNNASLPFGNDQCCNFQSGCMDYGNSQNVNPNAVADCQGNLIIDAMDYVNGNATLNDPYDQWPSFNNTNGSTDVGPGATTYADGSVCCVDNTQPPVPIEGCLDSNALNYFDGADGCPTVDPASNDPLNTDGYGGLDPNNNSCCLYTTYCQDPAAINDSPVQPTGSFPCNGTDAGPEGLYYGEIGFQPIFPGALHFTNAPGTTPVDDNDCCIYPEGCTNGYAVNYDASAVNDDGSCTFIFGCGDPNADNYDANATHVCSQTPNAPPSNGIAVGINDSPWSGWIFSLPTLSTLSVLNPQYWPATANYCCCNYGCTDLDTPGAHNYDPNATCDDGTCEYYVYGCTDPSAIPSSFDASADGCQDPNGATVPDNPNVIALATGADTHHCCVYTEPEWTYICQGDYDPINDDPGNPPNDGWGDCVEILPTDPYYATLQTLENQYQQQGLQLLFTSNISQVAAAALCAASCTGCQQLPTAGCSSCVIGAQGQACGTYTNDIDPIEDMYGTPNTILFWDDIDDCDGSAACGLELEGCTDPNYCEYYTQVLEDPANPGVYSNGGAATQPNPSGTMIGILGPTTLANGCINEINEGCPLTASTSYDPSATATCPNPYYTDPNDPPNPLNQYTDPLTGLITVDIPIQDIDWMNNSYSTVIMDECDFSCEQETVNGNQVPGAPLLVIENGGSCYTCAGTVVIGSQTMAPCVEVDSVNQYNQLEANAPFTLQWFNDGTTCDGATFCGGTLGCVDDGSGNVALFDAVRADAATNISPAWTTPGPQACNYVNDPTLAPDPSACIYDCVGCLDDGDPSNATPIRPVGFVGPAFNYEYACDGTYNQGAAVPAVDSNGETCCCYVAGCTDSTAPNYDPNACFDDGSCDYNVYGCTNPTSSNYNSNVTVACNGYNGYPPNNYSQAGGVSCDPTQIGTDNCCCSDVGFDCIDNLCTPAQGLGQFPSLGQCIASGCGSGRYKCCPYPCDPDPGSMVGLSKDDQLIPIDGGAVKPPKDPAGQEVSPVVGEQIGPILPNKHDDWMSNWVMNTDPNIPTELDCCIPDPMGPFTTMADCKQNSNCGDCDERMYKCKLNATQDTQSTHKCVETVQADPECLAGNCFPTLNACIQSGCEHTRETWVCRKTIEPIAVKDKSVMGEQNTGLTIIPGQYTPCVQSGYLGYETKQECEDKTRCDSPNYPDDPVYTCFIPETKIKMGDGTEKRIDEIVIGDEVLNDMGTTSKVRDIEVNNIEVTIYGINDDKAFVTKDHPLLVKKDGINEWKCIDPSWISHVDHGVDALKLEVGDIIIKGEGKEEIEVKSINEGGVVDVTYNLALDTVHTYFANDYIAHNAFFRKPLKEEKNVEIGKWVDDDPTTGCPCPPDGVISHPACCKFGPSGPNPGPPGPPSCPSGKFMCTIGYTWNPGGSPPSGGCPPDDFDPDCNCIRNSGPVCIACEEDPNNPGYCKQQGCDSPYGIHPCNGSPLIHQPTSPCQGLWCD